MGSFEQAMLNTAFGMNDTYAKALASYLFREVIEDAHVKYNISQADMKDMCKMAVNRASRTTPIYTGRSPYTPSRGLSGTTPRKPRTRSTSSKP